MPKKTVLLKEETCKTIRFDEKFMYSEYLERNVKVDFYIPSQILHPEGLSLLLINDGQDLVKMNFAKLLDGLIVKNEIEPLLCVGIHCGDDRKNEYGTICQADYKGFGSKAGLYSKFIFDELMPFIRKTYLIISFKEKSFAGFSLGGLSALDIVWNHAAEFRNVGVFSGSLWWRRRGYEDGYEDEKDRIMHMQVRKGQFCPWLKFFFECGTLDETADRNNNGIIDSIDDILDMIVELKIKGYTNEHIRYLELPEGKHDVETWKESFPDYLKWGWGK